MVASSFFSFICEAYECLRSRFGIRSVKKRLGRTRTFAGQFFYVYVDSNGRPVSQTHGGELILEGTSQSWLTVDVYVNEHCIGSGSVSFGDLVRTEKSKHALTLLFQMHRKRDPARDLAEKRAEARCFGFIKKNKHDKTPPRLHSFDNSSEIIVPDHKKGLPDHWNRHSPTWSPSSVGRSLSGPSPSRDIQRLDLRSPSGDRDSIHPKAPSNTFSKLSPSESHIHDLEIVDRHK